MDLVAFIFARGGSKGLPGKNIRLLNGKPLISHIVDTAVKSKVFDEIYINSESEVFKETAEYYKIKFFYNSH